MQALTFKLTLLEPLLVPTLQGDPNSVVSYNFIPGSVIRGGLIHWFMQQPQFNEANFATNPAARRLFFSGQTRYLSAYLLVDEKRSLPVPMSWHKDKKAKPGDDKTFDLAYPDFSHEITPKSVGEMFCVPETSIYDSPVTTVAIHTKRDQNRRMGRSTEGEGAVFRYEALAAGQSFGGVILCDHEADVEVLKPLLQGELWLGSSQRAGYGRVSLASVEVHDNWFEFAAVETISANKPFSVTLLSDMLIRATDGQYTDILTAEILATALGISPDQLEQTDAFKKSYWVSGFNKKWGLPLPQTLAIRAGSVFKFETKVDISEVTLQTLLQQGLGERRVEGFGRIAINWAGKDDEMTLTKPEDKELPQEILQGPHKIFAQAMLNRMVNQQLESRLVEMIDKTRIDPAPKASQLSGLRVVVRSAITKNKVEMVQDYLSNMKKTGRDQFEKARFKQGGNKQPLLSWLEDNLERLATKPTEFLAYTLGFSSDLTLGGVTWQPDQVMAVRYGLQWLDGVLARAMKEQKK